MFKHLSLSRSISLFCLLFTLSGIALAQDIKLPKGIIAIDGRVAPALALKDIDGNRFVLADYLTQQKGHWVFVHFWASWCVPCRKEMPAIQRLAENIGQLPLKLAVINTAENEDTVFEFLAVLAPDLTPLMDEDGLATEAWQPRGLPATYLVDPEGVIRYQALGGRPWDDAEYMHFLSGLMKENNR